ncbi:MAG TPA: hypothetical protein ENK49_01405, partial [Gammaproteobacteria bacterium]|nr:hypothetical protein [Gammaproteobacteria bacterium]
MNTREILSSGRQQLVQTATIFTGRMFAAILGFIVSLLVARLLGPVDFGLFSLFLTLLIVGANVLGEGFTPAIVHFYNRYAPQSISRANAVLSSALAWRLLLSVPVGIAGWAAGNWIAEAGFSEPAYGLPIGMGFMGACGAALWGITLAGLQATESFSLYAVVTPLINVLRLVSVALLIGIGQFTLSAVLG